MATTASSKKAKVCKCGCGQAVTGTHRYIHGHNSRGDTHPMWKGGRFVTGTGYVYIWCPTHPCATRDGYVMAHRLVMEKNIGRYLSENEQVHHINGNKQDNGIENLTIISAKEHGRIEGKKARGHEKPTAQKIKNNELQKFTKRYYNINIPTKQIAEYYKVSTPTVQETARRFGLVLRKRTGNRKVVF